tara:strand:+ start:344 stop:616 length:273 start_codon:yes stop_codon:yes gene_type:complete
LRQHDTSDPKDITGRYSLARQRRDRENKNIPLPFSSKATLPSFLTKTGDVLKFAAYFQEGVTESVVESERVHRCSIFYYVENGEWSVCYH